MHFLLVIKEASFSKFKIAIFMIVHDWDLIWRDKRKSNTTKWGKNYSKVKGPNMQ